MFTQRLSWGGGGLGHDILDMVPLIGLEVNLEPGSSVDLQQAHPAVLVQEGLWELGVHAAPCLHPCDALLMDVLFQLVQVLPEGPPRQGVGVGMVGELVALGAYMFVCDTDVRTHSHTMSLIRSATHSQSPTASHTQLHSTYQSQQ